MLFLFKTKVKMEDNYSSVYFLKHKNSSPIKIGHSKEPNPKRRIQSYLTYAPYGIDYLGHVTVRGKENSLLLEKKIHKQFKDFKLLKEWFSIEEKDIVSYLESIGLKYIKNNNEQKIKQKNKIVEFYKEQNNVQTTAINFNVSIQYVYRILKKNGVKPNKYKA